MMNTFAIKNTDSLQQRMESYGFLSDMFLSMLDENVTTNILKLDIAQHGSSQGMQQIEEFIRLQRTNKIEYVTQELAIDRAKLFRGVNADGYRPPYESLYLNQPPQDIIGGLNRFYAEIDCRISNDINESPEQIGVEFYYMQALCEKELEALENGLLDEAQVYNRLQQSFLKQHLGRWAGLFAQDMERQAETSFYRGIALLIQELVDGELASLAH
jgi:TorA maturation chaperone TorD